MRSPTLLSFFFFNDTATTEIYTLSLHDALPISQPHAVRGSLVRLPDISLDSNSVWWSVGWNKDRKSTRLNSSHGYISYAVFCLKKKKTHKHHETRPDNRRHRIRILHTLRKHTSL